MTRHLPLHEVNLNESEEQFVKLHAFHNHYSRSRSEGQCPYICVGERFAGYDGVNGKAFTAS
jgi:hypothetical protein